MTDPGYYDTSLPPGLMRAGRGRSTAARTPTGAGAGDGEPSAGAGATLTAGPDGYFPTVRAADRPRNLQELQERAQPATRAPWAAGASVPVGKSGKRAHWSGTEWKGGASPGYAGLEPPAEMVELGTQFPGDDSPGDLHR